MSSQISHHMDPKLLRETGGCFQLKGIVSFASSSQIFPVHEKQNKIV